MTGLPYTLRRFRLEDAPSLARFANNRKVWLNVRDAFPHPYTEENARDFIGFVLSSSTERIFAIEVAAEAVGSIGLKPQTDVYRLSLELGFWLGEPFWGRGIMTRAVGEVVDYAFQLPDINRVYAQVFEHNPASMRVLEKNGFQLEGILRKAVIKDGKLRDVHLYGKTA